MRLKFSSAVEDVTRFRYAHATGFSSAVADVVRFLDAFATEVFLRHEGRGAFPRVKLLQDEHEHAC